MVNEEYTIKEATAVKLIYEIEKWVNMCCKIIVTFSYEQKVMHGTSDMEIVQLMGDDSVENCAVLFTYIYIQRER